MKIKPLPTVLKLHCTFRLRDGKLYWRHNAAQPAWWNSRYAGARAGNKRDYVAVRVGTESYLIHRVIFKMTYGYDPNIVDHKDQNPSANDPLNLRDSTFSSNQHNRRKSKNNTSGFKGVYFLPLRALWMGRVYLKGKANCTKKFKTKQGAIKACRKLRKDLHGEFANDGELHS